MEVAERREPRPEVIKRNPDAKLAQVADDGDRRLRVVQKHALGHLEHQAGRCQAGPGDDASYVVEEGGVEQLGLTG